MANVKRTTSKRKPFSLYTQDELRASIATFLARLPSPEVSWVDEHLLVVAGESRRNQVEPDGPGSLASRAIKDQALQISAGRAGGAPRRRPGGRSAASSSPTASACERASITSSASPAGGVGGEQWRLPGPAAGGPACQRADARYVQADRFQQQ